MGANLLTSPAFDACLKWLRSNPNYYAITEHPASADSWPIVEFWDEEMSAIRFIICIDTPADVNYAYSVVKSISRKVGGEYRTETGAELSIIAEVFCPEIAPFQQD